MLEYSGVLRLPRWCRQKSHDLFRNKMLEHCLHVLSHLIYIGVEGRTSKYPVLLVLGGCSGGLRDYSKFIKIPVCPRILETLVVQSDHSCWYENYVTKVELDPLVIFKSSTYFSFENIFPLYTSTCMSVTRAV